MVIITALSLIGFNAVTLEPHLRKFELKPLITGIIFLTIGLMYAITAPLFGKLCDIFNNNLIVFSAILRKKVHDRSRRDLYISLGHVIRSLNI